MELCIKYRLNKITAIYITNQVVKAPVKPTNTIASKKNSAGDKK